ncbi:MULTISPECIES: hypothetical protein [unclassified Pseudovibrio]|uniref:hypothetical protein n=1 Tax=unclassified Pseudovibrio TaxID=2627060 RepID=UPI0007AE583C|nr:MULTISPECIES: hypothetical protein [unclassified Pseudovibrio]KZK94449.1 hypothetical protein PsW74_04591 [Pseudovibrio sp. W74]KZL07191.1 hypothetical protein PsAD14_04206 [Pseudovibrio sp. Ad14]
MQANAPTTTVLSMALEIAGFDHSPSLEECLKGIHRDFFGEYGHWAAVPDGDDVGDYYFWGIETHPDPKLRAQGALHRHIINQYYFVTNILYKPNPPAPVLEHLRPEGNPHPGFDEMRLDELYLKMQDFDPANYAPEAKAFFESLEIPAKLKELMLEQYKVAA